MTFRVKSIVAGLGLVASLGLVAFLVANHEAEPETTGGPATFRRLSETQFKRSIEEIFGPGINVAGRFDPPRREDGLMAIGDSKVAVSLSGFEQTELRARDIAAQVLAEDRRKTVMSCTPQSPQAYDESCAKAFVSHYGKLLYRRPLSQEELTSVLKVTKAAVEETADFYTGLQYGLARLLGSPNFIFRIERTERDPATGGQRVDAYSLASRISFLLWNAPPDGTLLDAAAQGGLEKPADIKKQVDRMLASPKFEQGVRAFFSDMLGYDRFDGLSKDQSLYPVYTSQLAADAREQTLRTIVDILLTRKGDYRDLFTTKKTFMNRNLGALYQAAVDDDAVKGWAPYTFDPEDPRKGLLTFAAFLMLDPTHEARTSPTIRGKTIRELFLCQKVPDPAGNVDFTQFQDPKNPLPTVRERLTAHRENPTCAGCHAITDPIGLAMENYDPVGNFRSIENGAPIDASGTFEDKPYKNAVELGQLLHDSPSISKCAVQRVYEYGVGRTIAAGERKWFQYLDGRFVNDEYQFPKLMAAVATSNAFRAVSAAPVAAN